MRSCLEKGEQVSTSGHAVVIAAELVRLSGLTGCRKVARGADAFREQDTSLTQKEESGIIR